MVVEDRWGAGHDVLAFTLRSKEDVIGIKQGQEMHGDGTVTPLANAPACRTGPTDLYRIIGPFADLCIKFRLGKPTHNASTAVILLRRDRQIVGGVVDNLSPVATLIKDQSGSARQIGAAVSADYLVELGIIDDRMLIQRDTKGLLSSDGPGPIHKLAA